MMDKTKRDCYCFGGVCGKRVVLFKDELYPAVFYVGEAKFNLTVEAPKTVEDLKARQLNDVKLTDAEYATLLNLFNQKAENPYRELELTGGLLNVYDTMIAIWHVYAIEREIE